MPHVDPSSSHHHIMSQSLVGAQAALLTAGGGYSHASGGCPSASGPPDFYVMMTPTPELMAASSGSRRRSDSSNSSPADLSTGGQKGPNIRDDKRRATHNEVERRRRDKINNWIMKLAKVVPECSQDHTKHGQVSIPSCLLSLSRLTS